MNYYWWKDTQDHVGNVYAKNEKDAVEIVERSFHNNVTDIELLEENVKRNHLTGKLYA